MDKHWVLVKIDEMAGLILDLHKDPELFELDDEKKEQYSNVRYDIIDYLISFPGALLYVEDSQRLKKYKAVVNFLWNTVELDELLDELYGGRLTDTMTNITGEMSQRCKKLRPTFISLKPEVHKEFSVYFKEAMSAWVHGLDNAAVILCFSLIENVLKEQIGNVKEETLYELDSSESPTKVRQVPFGRVIKAAYQEKMITYDQKEAIFDIKDKRNNAVHNMNEIDEDVAYDIIMETKDIIEHLLKESDTK